MIDPLIWLRSAFASGDTSHVAQAPVTSAAAIVVGFALAGALLFLAKRYVRSLPAAVGLATACSLSGIGLLFGGLWFVLAALSLPSPWRAGAFVVGGVTTLVLVARLWLQPPGAARTTRFRRVSYVVAVVLEVAAIIVASMVLPRTGSSKPAIRSTSSSRTFHP